MPHYTCPNLLIRYLRTKSNFSGTTTRVIGWDKLGCALWFLLRSLPLPSSPESNPPTNSSQSDNHHKHFQKLCTHQFCCRFSQNIANLFPSNNFVIKRCLYYKIHILSITVDLSILWDILKIYPNSNLTKKVKCYITSSKYRDCQVVGSCISTEE
jgi:hypothetical protein